MPSPHAHAEPAGTRRRITVGLPVYNDAERLYTSVPTVFEQSYDGPVRLLVVDDGSTDHTGAVLAELAERYPGIEVLTHERNLGRPFARNTVLDAAGEDLLAWIDADDLWHPRKLELQIAALEDADPEGTEAVLCTSPFRWVYPDRAQLNVRVPEVEGDQLYNALSGALQPYLWALLGRAELFREVGGFDERLLRRQDFEFMLRFLAAGGRVVRTDAGMPLATYMKTDAGRSGGEVSTANDVIWAEHEHLYRRYGRRFALEMRRSHYLLAARFHEHNDAAAERARYRLRAGGLAPVVWLTPPDVNVGDPLRIPKWLYWGTRRRVRDARRLARVARQQLRRWRRQATRSGRRLRAFLDGKRAALGLPGGDAEWRLARALPIAAWVGDAPAAAVVDRVSASTGRAGPEATRGAWLKLERTYRERGELHSAEQALERALADLPGDERLSLRLVELLSLRRQWARCIATWESLAPSALEHATATSYTRVARALRELGRDAEATEVAAEGLARFPDDARLPAEHARGRARVTDWPAALRAGATTGGGDATETSGGGAPSAAAGADPAPVGVATSLGFLAGVEGPIQGRLGEDARVGQEVRLLVNGEAVVATSASPSAEPDVVTFSLSCGELGEYLGDGDVLELATDDGPIAWQGYGPALAIEPGHPSRADELTDRLARGHVFNKFGQLRSGNTTARKRDVLDLYEEIAAVVTERTGHTLMPFYGNLLGAIREHDFLPHDVGGFDVAFLSEAASPEGVRADVLAVCEALVDAGYDLTMEPFSAMVRRQGATPLLVDINYCWVGEDGGLRMSYGWRYAPVTDPATFRAPRWAALADRLVPVPANAEAVLEQVYGPGWLVPDQGFQLAVGLQRDERYLLSWAEREALAERDPDRVHLKADPEEG